MTIIEQENAVFDITIMSITSAKETSFVFEPRIEPKHRLYRISSMKSRAKTMRHNQTAQTFIKSLLEHHALNRSYRFITDNIVPNLLFRRREVVV